ncbi:hypothetical protein BH09PSE2_BH09PSE2_12830 [soil metagenome]
MRLALLAATALAVPNFAFAQVPPAPAHDMASMPGMVMPPAPPPPADHDMAGMAGMGGMNHMSMAGALGDYPATRDASGTAWQPDSAPHDGLHLSYGEWSVMTHGYAAVVYDNQGGKRGDEKTFVLSHLMGVASHPLAGGTLTLRGLISLDPTIGKSGYPLLLQTGETDNGRTRLIDRQHPHDLIGELAAVYSHPITSGVSGFVYAGAAGEPALGPVAYLHRFAGMANPETPIDHHWLDSTHVQFGVVTAGVVAGDWKLEASGFTGREPNQNRYDIEHPRFDSWSARLSWNPTRDWSLQASRGRLHSPEQLEPEVDQNRTTASATYNRALHDGNWQTVFAWGRVEMLPPGLEKGATLDAYLLESALTKGANTVFGRVENADKNELFAETDPRAGTLENVSKLSVGYFRTLPLRSHVAVDLGGLVSKYALPSNLDKTYGKDPISFMLFARFKLTGS